MHTTFGLARESLSELQAGADTNGVALGVTPRVLPSVCPAVLVQWRRPRGSPVPQRLALDWISFSQQNVRKTISLEGFAKILVDGALCTEVKQGLGHQFGSASRTSLVSYVRLSTILGADVKLSAVLTCADIIKMPNRALCSQVGVSLG